MATKNYPYLGYKENDEGRRLVAMFTSKNEGVIVLAEYADDELPFGYNDTIEEDGWAFLEPNVPVRLQNE